MKLTKTERLVLINQYLILEKLYPDEAETYAQHREALEYGYSLHYDWLMEKLSDELTEEECREVLDILDMFSFIKDAYEKLEDKSGIDENKIKFQGFDGNNETHLMDYTRYFIHTLNRFQELIEDTADNFNSHLLSLPKYQRMLNKWISLDNKYSLSKKDILEIINN